MSRPRRSFDREFKLALMHQLEAGEKRPGQLCREHRLSASLLKRWRDQYAAAGDAAWPTSAAPTEEVDAAERFHELEAALGRLHMENELLRRALRQAEKGGFLPGRSGR
jgi:transposase-like protein